MNGPGHQFLTNTTFPSDQNRGICRGDPTNFAIDLFHRRTATDQFTFNPQLFAQGMDVILHPGQPGSQRFLPPQPFQRNPTLIGDRQSKLNIVGAQWIQWVRRIQMHQTVKFLIHA